MPVQTRFQTKNKNANIKPIYDIWFLQYFKNSIRSIQKIHTQGEQGEIDKLRIVYELMYNINEYFYEILLDDFNKWKNLATIICNKPIDLELIKNQKYKQGFIKLLQEVKTKLTKIIKCYSKLHSNLC